MKNVQTKVYDGFSFQFLKWMGVCGAEKSAPDKKEINIYILIKLYNIYII